MKPVGEPYAGNQHVRFIAEAQSAWARIRGNATFGDWLAIANALAIGRAYAMKLAKAKKPQGKRYVAAIGSWLRTYGLDGINAQERNRTLQLLDNLAAIEVWREGGDQGRARPWPPPYGGNRTFEITCTVPPRTYCTIRCHDPRPSPQPARAANGTRHQPHR
jgi:hypothetical protein